MGGTSEIIVQNTAGAFEWRLFDLFDPFERLNYYLNTGLGSNIYHRKPIVNMGIYIYIIYNNTHYEHFSVRRNVVNSNF